MFYASITSVDSIKIGNAKHYPVTASHPEFYTIDIVIVTPQGFTTLVAFSDHKPVAVEFDSQQRHAMAA